MKKDTTKNQLIFELDYHTTLFLYIVHKYNINNINNFRNKDSEDIVSFFTRTFSHYSNAINNKASFFIEALQQRLEIQMKKIISTKSVYYWFYLYRRIPPVPSFDNETAQTVLLYRTILESAFLKYGKQKTYSELIYNVDEKNVQLKSIANGLYEEALKYYKLNNVPSEMKGIFLGNFGLKELIEIYNLERLAYEFWYTTVCSRRICKGGILKIFDDLYYVENDDETEDLMKSFDLRNGYLEDLVCSHGISIYTTKLSGYGMFVSIYNVGQLKLDQTKNHKIFDLKCSSFNLENFTPNFNWFPLNFKYIFENHFSYSESFYQKNGYQLESFVYTLYLLAFREFCISSENNFGLENLQRSYRHFRSYDLLASDLMGYYESGNRSGVCLFNLNKSEIIKVLKDLTLPMETDHISLISLHPRYLIFPAIADDYIIDYAAIIPLLSTKMHYLKENENIKGHSFEDHVIERLKEKKFALWECKKKLKHNDGTLKEIDISFICNGFLFIGELKSTTFSLGFIKGDKKSLEFRKKKMINALSEVKEKIEWLSKHKAGNNYCIPREIIALVPFVISPFPEYIWSKDAQLWFTEKIPRICTPSECEKLCNDEIISELNKKPFVKFLN